MLIKLLILVVVAGISALISYLEGGVEGLKGGGIGLSIGAVMCLVSHFLLGWAKRAQGQSILVAMLGSMLASFGIMITFLVLLAHSWKEILTPAALSALVLYLVYRFLEAFQAQKLSGSSPHIGGGSKPAVGGTWK